MEIWGTTPLNEDDLRKIDSPHSRNNEDVVDYDTIDRSDHDSYNEQFKDSNLAVAQMLNNPDA
jgi:hypothetical protein